MGENLLVSAVVPQTPEGELLISLSSNNIVSEAFDDFSARYPQIIDLIKNQTDPISLVSFIDQHYRLNSSELPVIPEVKAPVHTWFKRKDNERWWERVSIRACFEGNYWNCIYGAALACQALHLSGYQFEVLTTGLDTHPIIKVKNGDQDIVLSFEDDGLALGGQRKLRSGTPVENMFPISDYHQFDGIWGLSIPELLLISKHVKKDDLNLGVLISQLSKITTQLRSIQTLNQLFPKLEIVVRAWKNELNNLTPNTKSTMFDEIPSQNETINRTATYIPLDQIGMPNAAGKKLEQEAKLEQVNWRETFAELTPEETKAMLENLVAILPQRGCEQRCIGCHASALPWVATAHWDDVQYVVAALDAATKDLGVKIQQSQPGAVVETFRDSDPAHAEITDHDRKRGIGDFSQLIHEKLGQLSKVMTSGVRAKKAPDFTGQESLWLNEHDLRQVEMAVPHCKRMSVSMSIETTQYRKLGHEADAKVLARTVEAMLRGSANSSENIPEVFMDLMFFSADGHDENTQNTIELFIDVLSQIDVALLSQDAKKFFLLKLLPFCSVDRAIKLMNKIVDESDRLSEEQAAELLRILKEKTSGALFTDNQKFFYEDTKVGMRVSPHLNIGRAETSQKGQELEQTAVSDWLTVLDGDPNDQISINGHFYSRSELKTNFSRRREFIEEAKAAAGEGFLKDGATITGNWLSFFRAEVDLKRPLEKKYTQVLLKQAPGANLHMGFNLVISNPAGNELQEVIPFAKINDPL